MDSIQDKKIEWLRGYGVLALECDRLRREIAEWRSTAERTTRALDRVPGGGTGGGVIELAVGEMCQLEGELVAALREKTALRREVEQAMEALDERLGHLLRLRYVEGLKWREVAEAMYYSDMQVMRLHKEALEKLAVPDWVLDGAARAA